MKISVTLDVGDKPDMDAINQFLLLAADTEIECQKGDHPVVAQPPSVFAEGQPTYSVTPAAFAAPAQQIPVGPEHIQELPAAVVPGSPLVSPPAAVVIAQPAPIAPPAVIAPAPAAPKASRGKPSRALTEWATSKGYTITKENRGVLEQQHAAEVMAAEQARQAAPPPAAAALQPVAAQPIPAAMPVSQPAGFAPPPAPVAQPAAPSMRVPTQEDFVKLWDELNRLRPGVATNRLGSNQWLDGSPKTGWWNFDSILNPNDRLRLEWEFNELARRIQTGEPLEPQPQQPAA